MLHHLPTQARQFSTLCEAFRLLRPGGVLLGADSLASQELHRFHEGDTYNPIDPARLLVFVQAAGFARDDADGRPGAAVSPPTNHLKGDR